MSKHVEATEQSQSMLRSAQKKIMIYTITVKPGSKKGPLVQAVSERELIVYLREKPIEGQANQALTAVLAEHFGVPKTTIIIKSGARGRKKLIEICDRS